MLENRAPLGVEPTDVLMLVLEVVLTRGRNKSSKEPESSDLNLNTDQINVLDQ